MTYQRPVAESSGSPAGRAIRGFFRFLVRFLFVLVVGVLIGAGLYVGVPRAYRSLVQPVQQNTARLAALEQRLGQELTRLQEQNRAFEKRIATVEGEMTTLKEESAVQAQQIAGALEQIQQLESRVTQAEGDLETQQKAVEAARSELNREITDLSEQTDQVTGQTQALEGRLALLQTAQGLLKVRVLLLEGNTQDARDTLTLATAHVERATALMPEQAQTLTALRERMVGLDQLIASNSFRVGPELESLWASLMDLVWPEASAEESTS